MKVLLEFGNRGGAVSHVVLPSARAELQAATNRRPALWERYENWLPVLPETR